MNCDKKGCTKRFYDTDTAEKEQEPEGAVSSGAVALKENSGTRGNRKPDLEIVDLDEEGK